MDKSSLHEHGAESGSPKPEWQKPSLKEEMGELQRHAEEFGVSFDALIKALESAELEELNDDDWRNMKNCDSSDPAWTLDQAKKRLKEKGRDFKKIEDGLKQGHTIPASIVLYRKGYPPSLVAGSSRLLMCHVLGIRPMVLAIRLDK